MSDIPSSYTHREMLMKASQIRKKQQATRIQSENKKLLNTLMYIQNGNELRVGHHIADHKVSSLYYNLWKR